MSGSKVDAWVVAIILVVVVGSWLFMFAAKGLGDRNIIEPKTNYAYIQYCDANHFAPEYGSFNPDFKYQNLEFDEKSYFLLTFDSNWTALVKNESGQCRFVTNENESQTVFEAIYHYNSIYQLPFSTYDNTIQCKKWASGANDICNFTGKIVSFVDSNVWNISATVPEEVFDVFAEKAQQNGWEIVERAGREWIRFSKKVVAIQGSEYFIFLQLTRDLSCTLTDKVDLSMFNLSNEIRQPFYDAKNRNYSSETVSRIDQTNFALWILTQSDEIDFSEPVEAIGNLGTSEQYCIGYNFKKDIEPSVLATQNVISESKLANDKYRSALADLQRPADTQMRLENDLREKNMSKGNPLKIVSWLGYVLYNSGSESEYKAGHYASAKDKAFKGTVFYNSYWDQTSDWGYLQILFLFLIIGAGFYWIINLRENPDSR
ncbi:MAG: hypothetical protein V1776_03785 [Candidatus Diapherotrites archaeon]